ncbi:MAG: hypothetical protein WDZ90_00655 [Candidatus Paceibacterota bacterium]
MGLFGKSLLSRDLALILLLLLTGFLSFGLGRLSVLSEVREPIRIEYGGQEATATLSSDASDDGTAEARSEGEFVGSTGGTKYHFPWCGGAQRIKEENKIFFTSKDDARKRGYTPAANCPGLD